MKKHCALSFSFISFLVCFFFFCPFFFFLFWTSTIAYLLSFVSNFISAHKFTQLTNTYLLCSCLPIRSVCSSFMLSLSSFCHPILSPSCWCTCRVFSSLLSFCFAILHNCFFYQQQFGASSGYKNYFFSVKAPL